MLFNLVFCLFFGLGTLVMRPAGNENKGAMKLRVDFKKIHSGDALSLCLHDTLENQIITSV